jgi:hypothetical protein
VTPIVSQEALELRRRAAQYRKEADAEADAEMAAILRKLAEAYDAAAADKEQGPPRR